MDLQFIVDVALVVFNSFKIVEGEGVGPIGQTRSQKIRDPVPDFPSPRLPNRTYTLAL